MYAIRSYYDHLSKMMIELEGIKSEAKELDTLLFSIYYHDIIYEVTNSDNEDNSAIFLKDRLIPTRFSQIDKCVYQIKQTKEHKKSRITSYNVCYTKLLRHREIKRLLDNDAIGELYTLNFRSRMGDGWGQDAYMGRQPYFRDYPKLLIYETGVHFIDTFRYHAGEVQRVYAILRKLNPVIKGEDSGWMMLEFNKGAKGLWDANRYNENNLPNPRYTFGEYLVEGSKGTIRLYSDGKITIQNLGKPELEHNRNNFV